MVGIRVGCGGGGGGLAVGFGLELEFLLLTELLHLFLFNLRALENSPAAGVLGEGLALLEDLLLQEVHRGFFSGLGL